MKVKNGKNKAGIPFREALLSLSFTEGFDHDKEYMDFIILLGIVETAGAYIRSSKYDFNIQGRAKFQVWLDEHPKEYEDIKLQVNQMLCGNTVLDEDNENPEEGMVEVTPPEVVAAEAAAAASDGEIEATEVPEIKMEG